MKGFHSIRLSGAADGTVITVVDPPQVEIRITARKARRLLRDVVADAGRGHHAVECGRYVRKDRLICLIAFVLHRAGMTVSEVAELDAWSPNEIERAQLPARVRMSRQARRVLYVAQDSQDWQNSWGEALDEALAVRPYAGQQLAGAA